MLSSVDFDVVLNEVCQVPEGSLDEGYLGVEIWGPWGSLAPTRGAFGRCRPHHFGMRWVFSGVSYKGLYLGSLTKQTKMQLWRFAARAAFFLAKLQSIVVAFFAHCMAASSIITVSNDFWLLPEKAAFYIRKRIFDRDRKCWFISYSATYRVVYKKPTFQEQMWCVLAVYCCI